MRRSESMLPCVTALAMGVLLLVCREAGAVDFPPTGPILASDSLNIGEEASADARDCLQGLAWNPGQFEVRCGPGGEDRGDLLVRFPTPMPSGTPSNDLVAMEWYVACNPAGEAIPARPVIVVHESGSRMTVGRLIAKNLRKLGLHAFLIHLPYYGERRQPERRPEGARILTVLQQAIADVRRARDAVAVLPLVNSEHIALQGTSLGGIVAATTAGLDQGYDSVFLMLAGGDLVTLLEKGQRDAAKFREELARAGITGEKLREVSKGIEPLRLAHRVAADRTWLYTGLYDQVVPPENSRLLAERLRLERSHQIHMIADHYSGIIYLPYVLEHMVQTIDGLSGGPQVTQ